MSAVGVGFDVACGSAPIRADLIPSAIANLKEKLFEELIVVGLVCLVFLFHARSALVAIITLPLGVLIAVVAMRALGIGADIMSLGGFAIAIGAMIDAAIIMIENMHKHLERVVGRKSSARPVRRSRRMVACIPRSSPSASAGP